MSVTRHWMWGGVAAASIVVAAAIFVVWRLGTSEGHLTGAITATSSFAPGTAGGACLRDLSVGPHSEVFSASQGRYFAERPRSFVAVMTVQAQGQSYKLVVGSRWERCPGNLFIGGRRRWRGHKGTSSVAQSRRSSLAASAGCQQGGSLFAGGKQDAESRSTKRNRCRGPGPFDLVLKYGHDLNDPAKRPLALWVISGAERSSG
jgi:hypothetical protein